ncbi:MAG: LysR substrate-binding domain-containing protein [Burkholderiales bacterium]|nr:LysR substrate-binding domain-containing protein [Burkholderiales bacterium]
MALDFKRLGKAFDAGLFKTVETLLRAGKLNRVADLVALSAPVAGFALATLRETIGDPLVVPTAAGVELTERAKRLTRPMRELLERIMDTLPRPQLFDPAFAEATFRVAASDYAAVAIGPKLAAAFSERAPRARLDIVPLDVREARRQLAAAEIDLAIGAGLRPAAKLFVERILTERWRIVARKGHPRVAKRITARDYASEPHVLVRPADPRAAKADPALSDPGEKRRAGVTVPHFLLVPDIVAQSDLIATLPERVALAADGRLHVLAPPVKLAGFTVAQVWHERTDEDPAHQWLRSVVSEIAALA